MSGVARSGWMPVPGLAAAGGLPLPTFRPGLLILQATLQPTRFRLAGLPLAFAISHATHGLAALVATVVCGGSMRSSRGLETAGTIADRPERNFSLRDHAPPRGPIQTAKSPGSSFSPRPLAEPRRKRRKKHTKSLPLRSTESSGNQGDREGDGPDKFWIERKQRRRRLG